jgi:hypothetical protein
MGQLLPSTFVPSWHRVYVRPSYGALWENGGWMWGINPGFGDCNVIRALPDRAPYGTCGNQPAQQLSPGVWGVTLGPSKYHPVWDRPAPNLPWQWKGWLFTDAQVAGKMRSISDPNRVTVGQPV